jgi:hypothetical protein
MKILALTDFVDRRGNPTNGVRVVKALKSLGHVCDVGNHRTNGRKLAGYDLILAFGTMVYSDRVSHVERIARAKDNGTVFALWYFDACNPDFKHSVQKYRSMRSAAPHLDWLVMTDHSYPWENHAKRFYHLMQGIDPDDYSYNIEELKEFDVVFTGGFRGAFKDRGSMISTLQRKYSVRIFGRNSPRSVFGRDFYCTHKKARVAFVPPPAPKVAYNYWSNRVYLAAATGTPCVVGYVKGLEEHYVGGEEVLYFNSKQELLEMTEYLVRNPAEAQRIGANGRNRTLTEHTYQDRAQALLKRIFE